MLAWLPLFLAAAVTSVPAVQTIPLPATCGDTPMSVAWTPNDELLVGSRSGVSRFSLRDQRCTQFIPGIAPPAGLTSVFNVAADDRAALAMGVPPGVYASRLSDGERIFSKQSGGFFVADVAISGTSIFLLAERVRPPSHGLPLPVVWRGNAGVDWSTLTPLHELRSEEASTLFLHSLFPYRGAIAAGPDRTLYVVTASEPGVFHYRHDGTLIAHLAPNLRELVVTRMPEMFREYAKDERGRYTQILNRQPTIDDLVVTGEGPAIVVRIAEGDAIRWELWFPDENGVRNRIRLEPARQGPFGYIRCDARGRRVACVMDRSKDDSPERGPASLVLFDLPRKPTRIAIDDSGWATVVDRGPALWEWSDSCGPRRHPAAECPRTTELTLKIDAPPDTDLSRVKIAWGTRAMLEEIPDALLPAGHADRPLIVPKDEEIFVRAIGESVASAWTRADAVVRARPAIAPDIRIVEGERGRVVMRSVAGLPFRGQSDAPLPPIPAAMFVKLIAWSEAGAPISISAAANRLPETVRLPPGFALSGRTIPAAAVTARFLLPGERAFAAHTATADAEGRFTLRGLSGVVEWRIEKEGRATIVRTASLTADVDLGTIDMPAARATRLLVTNQRNEPIEGARVQTAATHGITDARGVAQLSELPDVEASVTAPHYLPKSVTLPADAVTLDDAAVVRATIAAADDGRPLGGNAAVDLDGRLSIVDFDGGALEIDAARGGTISLEVRADGFAPFRIPRRQVRPAERVDLGAIAMQRGHALAGRVIERGTGAPVADAIVRILRPNHFAPSLSILRRDWIEVQTAPDGAFRIDGLAPGLYTLWLQSAERAPAIRSAAIEDGDRDLGTIELPRGHTLSVTCEPAARCGSTATVILDGADWLPIEARLVDGKAQLAPLPHGRAALRLLDRGVVAHEREIAIPEGDSAVHVQMTGVAVAGTIERAGKPVSGGVLRLASTGSAPAPFIQLVTSTPAGPMANDAIAAFPQQFSTPVDDSGRFAFDNISPGTYSATWGSSLPQRVEVQAKRDLRIALPGGAIEGVVRGERPLAMMAIAQQGAGECRAPVAADGSFSFPSLEPGPARIRVLAGDRSAEKSVAVIDGRTARVELTLERAETREVEVSVVAGGVPIANAFVFLHANGRLWSATTSADGRAAFTVPAELQTFAVAAFSAAHGWSFGSGTEVRLSRSAGAIRITSADRALPVAISINGFPLQQALALFGVAPAAAPGRAFHIDRLPRGSYTVRVGAAEQVIDVTDRVRELAF